MSTADHVSFRRDHGRPLVTTRRRRAKRGALDPYVAYSAMLMAWPALANSAHGSAQPGLGMASGNTTDLTAVAGASHLWVSGALVRETNAAWPFVRFGGLAEAHERGEGTEYTWQRYHEDHLDPLHPSSRWPSVNHGYVRCFRYSMGTLGFSRVPGYPHTGSYLTRDAGRRGPLPGHRPDGSELGTADAAGTVALVLFALPKSG